MSLYLRLDILRSIVCQPARRFLLPSFLTFWSHLFVTVQTPITQSSHIFFPQDPILWPDQHPSKSPFKHGRNLTEEVKRQSRSPQTMPQFPFCQATFSFLVKLVEEVFKWLGRKRPSESNVPVPLPCLFMYAFLTQSLKNGSGSQPGTVLYDCTTWRNAVKNKEVGIFQSNERQVR